MERIKILSPFSGIQEIKTFSRLSGMQRIRTLSLWSGVLGFLVVALGAWTRPVSYTHLTLPTILRV